MNNKECNQGISHRMPEKSLALEARLQGSLVKLGFDDETALSEASRCLRNTSCKSCDLCRLLCPDLAITRNKETRQIEVDELLCKLCGICELICPKGAIKIVID